MFAGRRQIRLLAEDEQKIKEYTYEDIK